MERLLSGARRSANLAFPDNDVRLRSEFQVGIHEPADFASEIERTGKVHAARLANPTARAAKAQAQATSCIPRHLPGLDGIRGLAIMMVMLGHFITIGGHLNNTHPLSRLLGSGFLGVDLFFALSSFLITGILLNSKMRQTSFRVFYLRRTLRIFPRYYAVLTISWLSVFWITPHDQDRLVGHHSMLWHWLYASNIGIAANHGNWLLSPTWVSLGHFWPLAVEEQFYLIWPLLVLLVSTRHSKKFVAEWYY